MWADGMGYAIAFAGPTARVRNVLELTNLVSMLEVYGTLDEALKAVHGRSRVRESVVRSRHSAATSQ